MTQDNSVKTVDKVLKNYKNLHCINCGTRGFGVQYDDLKQELQSLILELVGKTPPYKDGNWSYHEGQKQVRAELRDKIRSIF